VFNFQGSELFIILLLALVVLGPEKLPEAMRKLGNFYAQMKKMSSGFQQEFRSVIDEPMREMRETANLLRDSTDFRKLANGDRDEKPKSGEMAQAPTPAKAPVVAPADSTLVPASDVPFALDASVDVAAEAPVDTPSTPPTPPTPPPAPFGSHQRSSAAPSAPLAATHPKPDAATSTHDGPGDEGPGDERPFGDGSGDEGSDDEQSGDGRSDDEEPSA
jgi:sec-independent protein translocase protein TatB